MNSFEKEIQTPSYQLGCEFKAHSQNGEDGIIDYLIKRLPIKKKVCVEIGCGTGNENNTTYLFEQGWTGTVFDQKPKRIEMYKKAKYGGDAFCLRVVPESIDFVLNRVDRTPDFFSLDIDSCDYWVMKALLEKGFSPAICCLEYNRDRDDTAPYPTPREEKKTKSLNWGCGLEKWKELLSDYTFITVNSTRINCFFVRGTPPQEILDYPWLRN